MDKLTVKPVDFFGDELVAIKNEESGKIYTGVSYICKGIGLSKSQKDAQVQNVQNDLVLNRGCLKFQAGVIDPNNEVLGIELDFLPLWLAKISITPKMQEEQPKVTEKLVDYQLKAKNVLAQAFIKPMSKELQAIFMLDDKTSKLEGEVIKVKDDLENFRDNLPLLTVDCKNLQKTVKKIGTKTLGGYKSQAYCNNSLRAKVYSDIQHQIRREFGVETYAAIKRCQLNRALELINNYEAPLVLKDEITLANSQMAM